MGIDYEAVIYLVEKPLPGSSETKVLFGFTWGAMDTEVFYPRGYTKLKVLEVSDFMPPDKVFQWIGESQKRLNLPAAPQDLGDLVYF